MEVRSRIGNRAGHVIQMRDEDARRVIQAGTHDPARIGVNSKELPANWRDMSGPELQRLAASAGLDVPRKFMKRDDAYELVADLVRNSVPGPRVSSRDA